MSIYELQAPTKWAVPPPMWSSTTIDEVDACPRRWQLLNSAWGEYDRFPLRPSSAAIEGQIVHDALDRLTRACGQRGNPPFGSAEFAAAASDADFFPGFSRSVLEWKDKLAAHPRPGPSFRLRATAEELTNRAVRLFREQYQPDGRGCIGSMVAERAPGANSEVKALLRQRRALSEVKLRHPTLPFLGILDRVQLTADGIEIIDFKTGKPNERHRRQLLRYALLWWRLTGDLPSRIRAQYLDGSESWLVNQDDLEKVEQGLSTMVPHLTETLRFRPSVAKPSNGCHWCPVRAYCNEGWAVGEEAARADRRGDAELFVMESAGPCGFLARSRAGEEVAVVFEAAIASLLPERMVGETVRVVDGVWREMALQLEIKAWTEVFVVNA